jgi:hypothetical protein
MPMQMPISEAIYDAVVSVGPQHRETALKTIRSLRLFTTARTIYVVTAAEQFAFFRDAALSPDVRLIDEDDVLPGVTLHTVGDLLQQRIGSTKRAGWYLQQFLKMGFCGMPGIAPHYLIWDSDTIALQPLTFFDESGRVLVNPKTERYAPYFEWMQKALGLQRQVKFSFISEHLMVNTNWMKELIHAFSGVSAEDGTWMRTLLGFIDDRNLGGSGFSEYETYGNFVASRHPGSLIARRLKSTRHGTLHFGIHPSREALHWLMLAGHAFVSFESYAPQWPLRLRINEAAARAVFALSTRIARRFGAGSRRLALAAALCP